ncbi:MAG: hypothetical protein L3J97_02305 [Thermoplasmata archaeon]|nr:hypothetical protein [Thermoplasmata archaeon]
MSPPPPPGQYTPQPAYQQPPYEQPHQKNRMALYVGVAVLAVAAVTGLSVLAYEYQPGNVLNPYTIKVGQVIWTQNHGAALGTSTGFARHAGVDQTVGLDMFCEPGSDVFGPYSVTCDSGSVYVLTAGFGVVSTNAPFSWDSGLSGADATITVVLATPTGMSFNGNLAIDLH